MTGLLPPAQHGVVLTGVKAKPKGRAFGPAWTPAAGDTHQQRAGASRRTKIRQFQVSTVRGDGRTNGKLTLRYNSRLHHIGVGRRHAGTPRTGPRPRPAHPSALQ
jgi:hypothetical protein